MITKSEIQHVKLLRTKKFRQKYNQFVVEGEKAVGEILVSGFKIEMIYGLEEWELKNIAHLKGVNFTTVSPKELAKISGFEQPNKVLAIAYIPDNKFNNEMLNQPITIALDFIQDPGNLGTIIRTADWYGVKNILCSANCVDAYSPKVINATMGSFARVNVYYVDLEEVLTLHSENIYACVISGESLYETVTEKNSIVLIGNEGKGISENLLAIAQKKISIPRKGEAESLNAAIATAIIVDQLARMHH